MLSPKRTARVDLDKLLVKAKARVVAMPPEELDAMIAKQASGYFKAEASWSKPKFKWVNGTKVYDSYEDYCND